MSHNDDARLDATLRLFLDDRAGDTGAVRDATNITGVVALRLGSGRGRESAFRLAWVAIMLLLGTLAIGAWFAAAERRPTEADAGTLSWTRVDAGIEPARIVVIDDRFYAVSGDGASMARSDDGLDWNAVGPADPDRVYLDVMSLGGDQRTWGDALLGHRIIDDLSEVTLVRPGGSGPVSHTFGGAIKDVAVGSAGILALADEGVWRSADGESWTLLPNPDLGPYDQGGLEEVVAIDDGYIGRQHGYGDRSTFYTSDGTQWVRLGAGRDRPLKRWGASALEADYVVMTRWSAAGPEALPINTIDLVGRTWASAAGPAGFVAVTAHGVFYSPDGQRGSVQPNVGDMAEVIGRGALKTSVAVGADAVVMLSWTGGASDVATLWHGTRSDPRATATSDPAPTTTPRDATPTAALPTPVSSMAPGVLGDGPILTWSRIPAGVQRSQARVAWIGDRYYTWASITGLLASDDGIAWVPVDDREPGTSYARILGSTHPMASWQGDVVQWQPDSPDPLVRVVQQPAGMVESRHFDQHDNDVEDSVDAAAIGPAGIVAAGHTAFDYEGFVGRVLGPDWVEHMSTYGSRDADGAIVVWTDDGRFAEFPLAELGLTRADVADVSSGWHSVDGEVWTPIPDFPGAGTVDVDGPAGLVGTSEGFMLLDREATVWHSPDGFDWTAIGATIDPQHSEAYVGNLLPWGDGALATDGANRFDLWTADGRHPLPMTRALPDRDSGYVTEGEGAGPFGIVAVDSQTAQVLYSPDGTAWSIAPLPPDMARIAPYSTYNRAPTVTVGSDGVLVTLWSGVGGWSIWHGTVAP